MLKQLNKNTSQQSRALVFLLVLIGVIIVAMTFINLSNKPSVTTGGEQKAPAVQCPSNQTGTYPNCKQKDTTPVGQPFTNCSPDGSGGQNCTTQSPDGGVTTKHCSPNGSGGYNCY